MLKRKLYRTVALALCLLFITVRNIAQELQLNDTTIISEEPVIPVIPAPVLNKKAVSFVKKYLKEYDRTLAVARQRSEPIFPIMDSVFCIYNIPVQLKYMAVVESNLKFSARSNVGAVGLWQLMPATAKIFGLRVTNKYDERRYIYKSSVAAAKYLRVLYDEFGDWLLAVAAYNAGSGRVHYAIKMSGSHDFWKLQNFLPLETRNHVKRFIGVHYYFEGQGSEATLTKSETIQYRKTVAEFLDSNSLENEKVVVNRP